MDREKEIISQLIKGFRDIVPNGKVIGKWLSKRTVPYDLDSLVSSLMSLPDVRHQAGF